jgi:V/A-type H+-transporting ATPase subunit C
MLLVEETRQTRDALRYGFAVGKVRVLETRMLDQAAFERLLDATTLTEQLRLLSDTSYGRYLESAQTAEDVERGLDRALDDFYRYLEEAALPPEVTAFFRTRHDFTNLKAALKARLFGVPLKDLLVGHGAVPAEAFEGDLAELSEPLGSVAEELADATDTAVIDATVDAAMFGELLRLAKKVKNAFLGRIAQLLIDMGNVKTLVRGVHAGYSEERISGLMNPGGTIPPEQMSLLCPVDPAQLGAALSKFEVCRLLSTADLADPAALDLAVDAVLAGALRDGRKVPVGSEPVIAYVFAREIEAATLRMLLLGKVAGIPHGTLRARLRAAR